MSRYRMSQHGQAVLITLLVLTVAMTVVLSLISRTTTDTTLTREIEESSRAFDAAEAGVEEALRSGLAQSSATITAAGEDEKSASFETRVVTFSAANGFYTFPRPSAKGSVETLWLVPHTSAGVLDETSRYPDPSLTLCWPNADPIPALTVAVFYKHDVNDYRVARVAYDPDAARRTSNTFMTPFVGGCNDPNKYGATIRFGADLGLNTAIDIPLFMRIRPLYNDALITVQPTNALSLPIQGNKIESTGRTDTGLHRKVVVYQQYKAPLGVFDAAVYSLENFGH